MLLEYSKLLNMYYKKHNLSAGVNNGWLLPEQWGVGRGQLATGCKKSGIIFSESISNTYPNCRGIGATDY